MIRWLTAHFVPHATNDYRPHFLRAKAMIVVASTVIAFELAIVLTPVLTMLTGASFLATVMPSVLVREVNEQRESERLPVLTSNPLLEEAATLKARDMAAKGYFAHTSPEGLTPRHWLKQAGYHYQYAGENLAVNFSDSSDITEAWMKSPAHRANIVKGIYTEVGTGIATGMYKGKESVFVVQVYASPRAAAVPEEISAAEPVPAPADTAPTPHPDSPDPIPEPEPAAAEDAVPQPVAVPDIALQPAALALERMAVSPVDTTNALLLSIAGIIFGALVVKLLVQMKYHHMDLVGNALVVVALIGALYVTNNFYIRKTVDVPVDAAAAVSMWHSN